MIWMLLGVDVWPYVQTLVGLGLTALSGRMVYDAVAPKYYSGYGLVRTSPAMAIALSAIALAVTFIGVHSIVSGTPISNPFELLSRLLSKC